MRVGEPRTTMGTRPGLLVVVVATLSTILPGSYQYPQHVVFQPVTYQVPSMGRIDPDFTLVFPPTLRGSSEAPEDTSNQLICKKIQHGEGLFRVSPSTQASQLFFMPSSVSQHLVHSQLSRFFLAVPSVPPLGVADENIPSEVPEGTFAAPPPLMASLCVSQDSPRPFPVLFAPPSPSQLSSFENDLKKDILIKPFDAGFYSTPTHDLESPLKVSLNTPLMGEVTLGLHGVPATIVSTSPSRDDPAGRILVKLHTNPPGSLTLGFTGEGKTSQRPEDVELNYNTYRENGLFTPTLAPSVSLVFKDPVGSIGIGSPSSPAVNIEKQNIIASTKKGSKNIIPNDWTLYKDAFYVL